jgi:tetratricopeptide (TPR) repeat protein
VARDISQSVALELSPTQQVRLANFRQADPDAYENYLKGLYFWDKFTEAGMRKSIDHLQTSIDREPTYAMPYARLSRAYGILGNFGSLRPDEAYPRQEAVARKALALDDTLDEAHTAVGWSRLFYNRDWRGAQEEFRRAVELNPNSAVAHQGYAAYFLAMGDIDLALAEISRAQKLDPVSLNVKTDIAWILLCARRTDEAIAQLRQVREMDPGFPLAHFYFANAYMQKALFEQAIAEADSAVKLFQADARPRGLLGHAYAVAGRKIEAEQVLAELQKMGRRDYVSPYNIALIYAALGDKDRAFEWLEKAYSDRFWMMSFLKVDPRWDRLRSDARFQDLLRRMAFPS